MNCDCFNELEKKLAEKFTADLGKPAEVKCGGVAFTYAKTIELAHTTPFKVTADVPGYRKGKTVPFFASFCPFCGKATKQAADKS